MKKNIILLAMVVIFCSCSPKKVLIKITNTSSLDRVNEGIDLCLCAITEFNPEKINVYNEKNELVPTQLLYKGTKKPMELLFPVSLKSNMQAYYMIKEDKKTFESDTTSYNVEISNDEKQIKWNSNGLAFYTHGNDFNCSLDSNNYFLGSYMIKDEKGYLKVGDFDRVEILDNGPLRFSFITYYDSIPYKGENIVMTSLVDFDKKSSVSKVSLSLYGKNIPKEIEFNLSKKIKNSETFLPKRKDRMFYSFLVDSSKIFSGFVFNNTVDKFIENDKVLSSTIREDSFNDYSFYFNCFQNKEKINNFDDNMKLLEIKDKIDNPLSIEIIK